MGLLDSWGLLQRGAAVCLLGLLTTGCGGGADRAADLVLRNGAIYTIDPQSRKVEALAIRDGRIVYVGDDSGLQEWISDSTKVLDLQGKMVLPGFHDSHVHPATGGIELAECNLNDQSDPAKILETIQTYAKEHPDLAWIRGGGWDLPLFPDANPKKEALDAIVPDRPVFLSAADGHSAWVNSKALELSGIDHSTVNPPNGRIERDATGAPSGTLRESAMDLVESRMPAYTVQDYADGIRRALERANRFGITSLQEASASPVILEAYQRLAEANELHARVVVAQRVDTDRDVEQIQELVQRRDQIKGGMLRAGSAKIFVDGVIEAHTAALLEPYLDQGDRRGTPNLPPEKLNRLVAALDREGFQVHMHAIGDRAVRMALDACQSALEKNGLSDHRHQIAHLELIDPADIPRFAQLGVVADFQPLWAYADTYIKLLTEPVLGPERSRWLYPIHSVFATGARVAAGSDWSVSSMNPLDAIQVAITRQPLNDPTAPPWIPEERMDLDAMLRAYTIEGAYVNHEGAETGSLETGKAADLIVLDRDLHTIPASEIHQAQVVLTLLDGAVAYRDASSLRGLGQ